MVYACDGCGYIEGPYTGEPPVCPQCGEQVEDVEDNNDRLSQHLRREEGHE